MREEGGEREEEGGEREGTHVVLFDDFDEAGVVQVGEVACTRTGELARNDCRRVETLRRDRRTEVMHVRDNIRQVLLQIHKPILKLVIGRITQTIVVRSARLDVPVLALRLAITVRPLRLVRGVGGGDQVFHFGFVVGDLVCQFGDLCGRAKRDGEAGVVWVSLSKVKVGRGEKSDAPCSPGT